MPRKLECVTLRMFPTLRMLPNYSTDRVAFLRNKVKNVHIEHAYETYVSTSVQNTKRCVGKMPMVACVELLFTRHGVTGLATLCGYRYNRFPVCMES